MQYALTRFHLPVRSHELLAYLIIFGIAIIATLSLIPLPFALSLMIVGAQHWNPLLVALAGSSGACIGDLSGYWLGYVGKKMALQEELGVFKKVKSWINEHCFWAIAFLSFQPIVPVELGGFVAGAARMPIAKFLAALFIGKFPKYVLVVYAGLGLIHFFPRLSF